MRPTGKRWLGHEKQHCVNSVSERIARRCGIPLFYSVLKDSGRSGTRRCFGLSNMSRRDLRTPPGVLTPGTDPKNGPPQRGGGVGVSQEWNERKSSSLICRPFSTSNPIRECNSALAQYSHAPILHHSAWPDSRTRTATRLSSPKSCPTKLVVCRLQTPMASEVGRTKGLWAVQEDDFLTS
jgi:hypothetical protein